jgi:hypothetical protein
MNQRVFKKKKYQTVLFHPYFDSQEWFVQLLALLPFTTHLLSLPTVANEKCTYTYCIKETKHLIDGKCSIIGVHFIHKSPAS